jgi:hypothetical protein
MVELSTEARQACCVLEYLSPTDQGRYDIRAFDDARCSITLETAGDLRRERTVRAPLLLNLFYCE